LTRMYLFEIMINSSCNKVLLYVFIGVFVLIGLIGTSSLYSNIGEFVIMLDLVQHDNGDTPTTNIGYFLSGVGDGRHECITITGLAEELSNDMYQSHGVPKNADAACHAFWAGMGEKVY
ncbi:MAG: hypothetical protein ACO34C_08685, partial [Candidatus Kapaibacteriota bacterium]